MERAELSQALRGWRSEEQSARSREPILISESDPARFMGAFANAVAGDSEVFLCDPQWGAAEKPQVEALLKSRSEKRESKISQGWLMIPTGGSSGRVKFARHDQDTFAAAVHGFTQHFDLPQVNAVGVLPLHHVSGLMAWMRCAFTGGDYRPAEWKAIERGRRPVLEPRPGGWVISLVPTQLERLLHESGAVAWLKSFRMIILGGAPAWPDLLDRSAAHRLPLSLGYGMTETAAMVAALRPEELLGGDRSSGRALPHVHLGLEEDGTIFLESEALFRGYYPEFRPARRFLTADLGRMDRGRLLVLGRQDSAINTGGEKVHPAEIEAVLRATGEFEDVAVVGLPDQEWGQVVVAAYVTAGRPDLAKVDTLLAAQLAPAKRPRRFVALAEWPRTAAGKLDRAQLERMVNRQLKPHP